MTTGDSEKYRRYAEPRKCKTCGTTFTPKVNAFNQPEKYCSKECFKKGLIKNTNKHIKKKLREDESFNFNSRVRSIYTRSLKNNDQWSEETWTERTGYTPGELKKHLESKWTESMSWENYGEWTIDHVVPTSFFEFTDYSDPAFRACWSLDNIRPMWMTDNVRKRNTLEISALHKVPLVLSLNLDLLQICYNLDGNLIKLRHGGNVDPRYVELAKKAFLSTLK